MAVPTHSSLAQPSSQPHRQWRGGGGEFKQLLQKPATPTRPSHALTALQSSQTI